MDPSNPNSLVLYQTRDENGTVSLHDLQANNGRNGCSVTELETFSQTFCQAAPCMGNPNLLALPCEQDAFATVRDVRMSPSSSPVACFPGAGASGEHGMLTSLALSDTGSGGRPTLACGMESGHLFLHDLAATPSPDPCHLQLSKDAILALDMAPSVLPESSEAKESVVAIAGMAGDAADLSERPESERGTVALVKATYNDDRLEARLRARLATCQINEASSGKPGVSICRFRPDGRIFAVGGWDRRLRIFDRSQTAAPLAILRAHEASVNAMDWAPDASTSGVLATGAGDGSIYIWRCFSS